jgi:hypothetical protein
MNWWILAVGLFTFALLVGGVTFTFMEFRRLERRYPKG